MVVPNKSQTSKNQKCHTKGFLSPHLTGLTNWWPRAQNCQRAFWFESYSRFVFFFLIGNKCQFIQRSHVNSRSPKTGNASHVPHTVTAAEAGQWSPPPLEPGQELSSPRPARFSHSCHPGPQRYLPLLPVPSANAFF